MDRNEKKELVETLNKNVSAAAIVLVAHYKGLTVAEMTKLRINVRKSGAGFKVAKNRLVRLALAGTKFEQTSAMFIGPTAIAYSSDPVAIAKVLAEFAKQNEKLVLLGGAFGERMLDAKAVQELSKMPSLDELRAKIVGLLQAPAQKIAAVLVAPASQLARVTDAYSKKSA